MRWKLFGVVGLLVGAAVAGPRAQQQLVIFANIVDGTGAPVATLAPDDIRLTENGADAKVIKVEPVNWPVKLQLLVDNGVGLGSANLNNLRNGVRGLIEALPQGVEVTFVTTAPQPRTLVKPTTDKAAMLKGIDLLSPDTGAGRFVESLKEATQRIEKDKGNYFPVIISMGTTSGDRNVLDSDVQSAMKRLEQRPTTVHVVLFSGGGQTSTGGATQTQVGMAAAQFTQGRFENINSATRLDTLLPELGAQVAKSHERQSHQFKITAERPAGAKGPADKVSMGARSGLVASGISFDGRLP